ncbi:carboxylesterase/lipase family protein [Streptomyces sp. NPDC051677]|uniref:carboxylesterase/lipase family protein n=1 Tax=Streptomyces sp. NPDC051677 TaxID=3365669 RepID=UPI0037CCDFCE
MSGAEFPEVMTTAGAVRGRREAGLTVFRGIPYAQPPVGEARFAAPRPVRRWDGVREAVVFGPPPPQEPLGPDAAPPGGLAVDDDWLTVNLWTPDADAAARRPVMVWIYGGAYKFGSSDDPAYDGSRLSSDGELVVVTLNYRVGMEGFARIEGAPANRGLLDQVAALEWVRDNITAFGGDPDRVTVFGESAGAGSIAALLAMPSARGLFGRAIAQSVPGTFFSDALAADIAETIAGELGLRPTVADLSGVDPRKLPHAGAAVSARMREYAHRWGPVALTPTPFSPVVDGEVLTATPWEALASGAARDIELIVGHNRDEYRLFLLLAGLLGQVDDGLASTALGLFGPTPDAERAYRAAFPDASAEQLFELVQSDWLFRMPSLHLAQAHAAGGGRAHLYELTWPAPANGGALGACHGLDVPLTFGVYDGLGAMLIGPTPAPETEALSARFRSAWTAFAATGDPGWPAYDTEQRLVQLLDAEPAVAAYPEEASRRIWERHTFTSLTLAP